MRGKNPRQIYETEILDMPPGIERAVMRVITPHVGDDLAISKPDLLRAVSSLGFGKGVTPSTFERQVRRAIVSLRKDGKLICSSAGEGGYFMASSRAEYEDFAGAEYRSKIADMAETVKAMDEGARAMFGGAGVQVSLF